LISSWFGLTAKGLLTAYPVEYAISFIIESIWFSTELNQTWTIDLEENYTGMYAFLKGAAPKISGVRARHLSESRLFAHSINEAIQIHSGLRSP
jgi:hypothetical protein